MATRGEPTELIDKKWLIRLLYKPIVEVRDLSPEQLTVIFSSYPAAKNILGIVDEFKALIKAKNPDALELWIDKALALGRPEIDTFINGLWRDMDAVVNAVASDFSNGLVEGTINKIKVVKRIMYGRYRFHLLRNKCLLLYDFSCPQLSSERTGFTLTYL